MIRARISYVLPALAVLLALAMVAATGFGAENLPTATVFEVLRGHLTGAVATDPGIDTIVWQLRVPRTVLAAVVGAGLALAGAAMQTLVRNPLADPYLLGVSSGAGVGAAAVITSGFLAGAGVWALSGGALAGAFAASAAVFVIALAQGGLTPLRLVLTGTVLGSAFAALSSYLIFRSSDPAAAQRVLFWLLGSLSGADWTRVGLPATVVAIAAVGLFAVSGWLDALHVGADTAASVGVPVRALRIGLFTGLAILVGVLVAVSGGIGFVGLVVPHAARLLVGSPHRTLLPVCAVSGALFLVVADAGARVLVRPTEIPVGVLTGLIGAPVFLLLLGRRGYRYGAA
ncbi:FecCD family ABC transporter permease [Nocardia pseudobrasiliensis]|uniref:Iron complex transport system permease protein n=1 Tax=Nocardia pseudobrasiliensis TaxID=45979 RepID=A0A370I3U3_9NOCA|nr:iron ABC transporter permease [Nocardia pseudobrasiliensis]RDI65396.1 iron complex transport system permease protein [Nocardia pseudobrasiliensis]